MRGALMPLPVAGLCPEPASILIQTQRGESDAPFSLHSCLGFPGMWPQAPSHLTCPQPISTPALVSL